MNPVVLDSCVWINGILGVNEHCSLIIDKIVSKSLSVFVSSYSIVEVISVLRRISSDYSISSTDLERSFWKIINLENIIKEFSLDITQLLLAEIRNQTEITMLAKILELESKAIPFILLSYKNNVPLITEDYRSLWKKRNKVRDLVGVEILLSKEFITSF